MYSFFIFFFFPFLFFIFLLNFFLIVLKQHNPGEFLQSYNLHNCSHSPPNWKPNQKGEGRREELSLLLCEKVLLN